MAYRAASCFDGPRPGYAFRLGPQGLGYYADQAAQVEITANDLLAQRPDGVRNRVNAGPPAKNYFVAANSEYHAPATRQRHLNARTWAENAATDHPIETGMEHAAIPIAVPHSPRPHSPSATEARFYPSAYRGHRSGTYGALAEREDALMARLPRAPPSPRPAAARAAESLT